MKQPSVSRPHAIVLASGGLDSTACIQFYLDLDWEVKALFVDYGQAAIDAETESVCAVASHYAIDLAIAKLSAPTRFGVGEIRGRNAFLVFTALLVYPDLSGVIAMGIHSGTAYYDCSDRFLYQVTQVAEEYSEGQAKIDAPFLTWTKPMIYAYCQERGVPVSLTYSCELGTSPPCGHCNSCLDRGALGAR